MEIAIWVVIGILAAAVAVLAWVALRGRPDDGDQALQAAERLAHGQSELTGRLQQIQSALDERLDAMGRRLGHGLMEQTEKTGESLRVLQERLAVIDAAQKNITDLSQQVVGLQDILSNKQTRGAFGEIQLGDLITGVLAPDAFAFQATLSNGKRADCLLRLPNPPGPIVIDAKFPLESYQALRAAQDQATLNRAASAFAADVKKHIVDIQERYIIPGETAESALMFLPSEAVYAELHANFRNVVEESYRRRVWIVSPTTLMATLNTVRAVFRDVRMREQAHVIQAEIRRMAGDVGRLDKRVANLQKHFGQATDDMRDIRISTEKITKSAQRVDEVRLDEPEQETRLEG